MRHSSRFVLAASVLMVSLLSPADAAERSAKSPEQDAAAALVEKLGLALYRQDALAAYATDKLAEKVGPLKQGMFDGYLAFPGKRGGAVRFLFMDGEDVRVAYDVAIVEHEATITAGMGLVVRDEQVAMFRARQLALKNTDGGCSEFYNSAVMPDPQGRGWLVYALAASKRTNDLVIGGHKKVLVSSDGMKILELLPLSKSCFVFDTEGKKGEFITITHLVTDIPAENHILASLQVQIPIFVGTSTGMWVVSNGEMAWVANLPANKPSQPTPDGAAERRR